MLSKETIRKNEAKIDAALAELDAEDKAEREVGIPQEYKARKERPIATGVLDYFPDAIAEVAYVSFVGNQQHNPGEPLHWAKEKSQDEEDAAARHMTDRFSKDTDGTYHAAKWAWRALAFLQKLIEAERLGMTYDAYNKHLKEKVNG